MIPAMNFIAAILVFVVFAALIGTGIVLMLAGKPLLLIIALALFIGAFIKHDCLSH